jgi:hypothetical protein
VLFSICNKKFNLAGMIPLLVDIRSAKCSKIHPVLQLLIIKLAEILEAKRRSLPCRLEKFAPYFNERGFSFWNIAVNNQFLGKYCSFGFNELPYLNYPL